MNCKICRNKTEIAFEARVLNKYRIKYFNCNNCGFLFAEEPYWLKDSYQSVINISDTGIMDRNLYFSKIVSVLIYFLFDKSGKFVDYAGGYGIFTRLMRDIGFDFFWHDPYCENFLARGFEYNESMNEKIELITAFEVFEHLVNPINEIEKMLSISNSIAFSTEILPTPVPNPNDWWYYGSEHGQHIAFYSHKTLKFIANKFGLNFYSYKGIHLFTKKNLSNYIFEMLIIFSRLGLSSLVKIRLTSKTWNDHLLLKK